LIPGAAHANTTEIRFLVQLPNSEAPFIDSSARAFTIPGSLPPRLQPTTFFIIVPIHNGLS
jgi:hypothetical protein